MPVTVASLRIYPVKSLRGVDVAQAQLEKRGLQYDRRWMVVDDNGVFLTQRDFPKMATVGVEITPAGLRFSKTGMQNVDVPDVQRERKAVQVWGKRVSARTVSREADEWLTEALGRPCTLVRMPDTAKRRVSPPFNSGDDVVSFADAMPVLVASEASLEDLNARLEHPIPIDRFRPNIILRGCNPFEEDDWKSLSIGGAGLRSSKKCNRCQITTTDQLTGELTGQEPLRTLARFRRNGRGVAFGMYYIPTTLGVMNVGDSVEAE